MPPTVADVLPRLRSVCIDGVTHADYDLTVRRATQYRRFATGAGLELEMRRFAAQETVEQYASRVAMWIKTAPAWWAMASKNFYEVARLRGGTITRRVDYPEGTPPTEAERLTLRLMGALNSFFQRKPLENYLSEQLAKSDMQSDPNAWLAVDFTLNDYRTEVAQPYPVRVPCEAAVDFQRLAGVTTYFTGRFTVPQATDRFRYICYLDNDAVDCWPVVQVGADYLPTIPGGPEKADGVFLEKPDDANSRVVYHYRILRHRAGRVPAFMIGYAQDEEGTGETCVSPLHTGVCYLLQQNKVGSENDVVMSKMSSPIEASYTRPCPGEAKPIEFGGGYYSCVNGINVELMRRCGACGGSGEARIGSDTSLKAVTLPFPNKDEEMRVKPADLMAFIAPPTENPKMQLTYLDRAGKLFMQTIFGTYSGERVAGSMTATESQITRQSELTALAPFADKFSDLYVQVATVAAAYVDAGQPVVVYEFPDDLERTTLADLFDERERAVKAGADSNVLAGLDRRIALKQYANDPDGLRRNEVQRRFIAYLGQTEAQVRTDYVLGLAPREYVLLRNSADIIFGELEVEEPDFYRLPYAAQLDRVNQKVADLAAKLPATGGSSAFKAMSFTQSGPAEPATV